MARARSTLATWLAVLGGVVIALGVSGLWVQRTIGDPQTFAGLAGDILAQPNVRTELAVVIVDPVLAQAPKEVQEQRPFIVTTTAQVLGDARFVPVFRGVLRRAATSLVDGRGPVRLDLQEPLDWVVTEVRPISQDLADQLEAITPPEPEVVSAAQADRLRGFVSFERVVAVALLVVGVALVVVAVVLGGPRALLPFGTTLAGACLVLFGVLLLGRTLLLSGIEPASRADAAKTAWDVVLSDLRTALLVSAAAGVLAVVAGGVLGRRA